MGTGKHGMTPLAAVVGGVLAGVVGTVCLDAVNYLKYRSTGGKDSPLTWEFPKVERWDQAPAPGQVGKRLVEGFTQHELPDRWAGPVSTIMHWSYGSGWGALYGILAGSLRRPAPLWPAVRRGDLGLGLRPPPGGRALQADLGVRRQDAGR